MIVKGLDGHTLQVLYNEASMHIELRKGLLDEGAAYTEIEPQIDFWEKVRNWIAYEAIQRHITIEIEET